MVSFANTVPANGLLDNVATTLLETSNSSLANNYIISTQPNANNGEVVSNYLLVRIRTSSCTATVTISVYGNSVTLSATASTCAGAIRMLLAALPRKV